MLAVLHHIQFGFTERRVRELYPLGALGCLLFGAVKTACRYSTGNLMEVALLAGKDLIILSRVRMAHELVACGVFKLQDGLVLAASEIGLDFTWLHILSESHDTTPSDYLISNLFDVLN